jgi:hypothetical protein
MTEIVQVAALVPAVYVSVFVAVRLAGRRTVSQMSAFDFVVTIAVGSLVATTILSSETRACFYGANKRPDAYRLSKAPSRRGGKVHHHDFVRPLRGGQSVARQSEKVMGR